MELLVLVAVLSVFALSASLAGYDSRPSINDEPYQAI